MLRWSVRLVLLGAAWSVLPAQATLPFSDREDGVSCAFYDVALGLPWPGGRPQWLDAAGTAGGPKPLGSDRASADDTRRVRELDLTALVRQWWVGAQPNDGLLLRMGDAAAVVQFHSRSAADPALRPQLLLTFADGRRRFVEATASATLDCSTYKGLGPAPLLTARSDTTLALRFDRLHGKDALDRGTPPQKAELVLVRADARAVAYRLDAYRVGPPFGTVAEPHPDGIAARHPRDVGIETDPDVLFVDRFDGATVDPRWTAGARTSHSVVTSDQALGFEPLAGGALRVQIARGQQLGLDLRYRFARHLATEPDEMYFRYQLRLAADWLRASDGGKLPGFAGTYGRAGWGGRPWDGKQGWSLRGSFGVAPTTGHPAQGRVILGTYAYHARSQLYGEGVGWSGSGMGGLIEPGRWYAVEQRVRMNTPGREDGVLQVWVDGRLVLDRSDLRLRDVATIHLEEVWMNFFHGGTAAAPADMHAYIDGVVIARRYIGPMAR